MASDRVSSLALTACFAYWMRARGHMRRFDPGGSALGGPKVTKHNALATVLAWHCASNGAWLCLRGGDTPTTMRVWPELPDPR